MSQASNLPLPIEIPDEPVDYEDNPLEAKLWARHMWWYERATLNEIASAINTAGWRVRKWVYGDQSNDGWKKEKEAELAKTLRKDIRTQQSRIHSLLENMLLILEKSAHKIIDERHLLNVQEFNSFTSAFEKLFKTRQLIMGSPTEIYGVDSTKELTWESVYKRMREVDILDYKEVEEIEVPSEKVNESELN